MAAVGEAQTSFDPEWRKWRPGQPFHIIKPLPEVFWQQKPKWSKRFHQDKAVLVNVNVNGVPDRPTRRLALVGGGLVQAPMEFTYQKAQSFESFPAVSDYIKRARFKKDQGVLEMTTAAFGYSSDLHIQIQAADPKPEFRELLFRVVNGVFAGLSGTLRVYRRGEEQSEVAFLGGFDFVRLPAPEFFFDFGLEVALHKMASRLRGYVEEEWKKARMRPWRPEEQ